GRGTRDRMLARDSLPAGEYVARRRHELAPALASEQPQRGRVNDAAESDEDDELDETRRRIQRMPQREDGRGHEERGARGRSERVEKLPEGYTEEAERGRERHRAGDERREQETGGRTGGPAGRGGPEAGGERRPGGGRPGGEPTPRAPGP